MNFLVVIYWVKRKIWQIKNVIGWLPIIWNQYDFDYVYAIKVFRYQLSKTAKFLESDKSYGISAKEKSKKIRTTIKLMDKLYDEDGVEYFDVMEEMYGKYEVQFKNNEVVKVWDKKYTKEELTKIDEVESEAIKMSYEAENNMHKLLWVMIERDIREWWD